MSTLPGNHKDTHLLPNGKPFDFWTPVLEFSKTLHVDARAPGASDDNSGTRIRPLKSISRAAELLEPGQRVVIGAGTYRECVRPARGGLSAEKMISYQAARGAKVVVCGTRAVRDGWQRVGRAGNIWKVSLPSEWFGPDTPFTTPNISPAQFNIMPWAEGLRKLKPYSLPAGMVFQSGRRLVQAWTRNTMVKASGTYWVSPGGRTLYVHPSGKGGPKAIEITLRSQGFAPAKPGLGFLHVSGLVIERMGNAFPMPQYGALSTTRGHHWLLENNTVRQINSLGVDIGGQHPTVPQPRRKPGQHIVRGNTIAHCGVCGLQALPCRKSLIENNLLLRNAFHDVEIYFECGAIKTHITTDSLIRGNVALDTLHGPGIWTDAHNTNSRVTHNVIAGSRTIFGALFAEISTRPNLYDHNVVWDTQGCGIYEHDCGSQIFHANFVGRSSKQAMWLRGACTQRTQKTLRYDNHTVTDNLLYQNGGPIDLQKPRKLSGNIEKGITASFDRKRMKVTYRLKK